MRKVRKSRSKVCGRGVRGLLPTDTKSYTVWHSMLVRCYDPKFQKDNPSYINCSVCNKMKLDLTLVDFISKMKQIIKHTGDKHVY